MQDAGDKAGPRQGAACGPAAAVQPSAGSAKRPTLAKARKTRESAPACVCVASASLAHDGGPSGAACR